jgi:amino acid permease
MRARARDDAGLTFATRPQEAPRELTRLLKTRRLNMTATGGSIGTGRLPLVRYEGMNVGELH